MNTVSLDAFLLTISATATTSFKFSTFDCNTTTPISPLKPRGDIVSRFSKPIDWKDNLYMFPLLSKENSPVSILRTPPRKRFVLSKAETVTKGTQEESDTDTIFPLTCAKQVKGNKITSTLPKCTSSLKFFIINDSPTIIFYTMFQQFILSLMTTKNFINFHTYFYH